MKNKECVAMILAGGQGSRLGVLTKEIAKPAVYFGGKYRIIDFTLSNCVNSGIDTVGVLTQYQPLELNTYIGSGQPWDLDRLSGGVYVLPPYMQAEKGEWYKGTANAIYQNISFIERINPKFVLVLSGDHIYKMDYSKMLDFHKEKNATATIAVINVEKSEASRFGIMSCDNKETILKFEEKPKNPSSTLASMGVYIFNWQALKKYLISDEKDEKSANDFGKNIIPNMLKSKERLFAYNFEGYWQDVGTIKSLWDANMDILASPPKFDLYDENFSIYSRNPVKPPHFISHHSFVQNSCITEGCNIYGTVTNSIIFEGVYVFNNAVIKDSLIMPNVRIGNGAVINKAIIGANTVISDFAQIGVDCDDAKYFKNNICEEDLTLVGHRLFIDKGIKIKNGSMVEKDITNQTFDFTKQKIKNSLIQRGAI